MKKSIGQQAIDDFWRSTSIVTSACAGAAGWSVEIHDEEAAASPSVLLYVWDSETGWTWLCSVPSVVLHFVWNLSGCLRG